MLLVLSPAKNLNEAPEHSALSASKPGLLADSARLAAKLATFSPLRLQRLMGISKELAVLNHERYRTWATAPLKQALFLFNGEAYRGLDARSLDVDDLRFAQRHLRILSGMFGVLRPGDLIPPHRLEMGTKLAMGRGMKDLHAFWGGRITSELNSALKLNGEDVLLNLASAEYFKSVDTGRLAARVITPVFKEESAGALRMVGVFAKHQRGAMARWVIRNRVLEPEAIKKYDGDGYRYRAAGSTAEEWLFAR